MLLVAIVEGALGDPAANVDETEDAQPCCRPSICPVASAFGGVAVPVSPCCFSELSTTFWM